MEDRSTVMAQQRRKHDHRSCEDVHCVPSVESLMRIEVFGRMVELEQICEVAGSNMVQSFVGQQHQLIFGTIMNRKPV